MARFSLLPARTLVAALALAAGGLCLSACASAAPTSAVPPAIVAIGDLHGDYDAYFSLIRAAGLADAKGRWTGGKTIFVQTGDIPDRGPDTKKIVEHMMKLEKAAKRKGGAVVALIGNHEAMNMTGDLRYVTPQEYSAFATRGSKKVRDDYFKANLERLIAYYRARNPAVTEEGVRAAFDADVPLGYIEHRRAWSPTGKFGAWTVAHDAMRIVGDTLFVHGGVSSAYVTIPIAEINSQVRAALIARDGAILTAENSPLWHRGQASETPAGEAEVTAALAAFGVRRLVIGHTPALEGVTALYGGRVIVIDTGASAAYGGTRSFLRIDQDGVTANDDGVSRRLSGGQ